MALGEARDTAERQLAAEERKKGKVRACVACVVLLCLFYCRWASQAYHGSCDCLGWHLPPAGRSPGCRANPPALPLFITLQAAAERVAAFKRTMDRCHARVQVRCVSCCCSGCKQQNHLKTAEVDMC